MNNTELELLKIIADMDGTPDGAFNIRANGGLAERHVTENVDIRTKEDKSGIDIIIKAGTKGEKIHIPVIISETGLKELVYNDFYIGDDADVEIVAGCGIHNCGSEESRHDGIHTFFVGKNAKVKYTEKHFGDGDGEGGRNMNPTTVINIADKVIVVSAGKIKNQGKKDEVLADLLGSTDMGCRVLIEKG